MTDNTDPIPVTRTDGDIYEGTIPSDHQAYDLVASRTTRPASIDFEDASMTDNTDLIARLRLHWADRTVPQLIQERQEAADALAARDAACGHLPNQLVAKALDAASSSHDVIGRFTDDEWDALRATTFKATE